MRISWLDYDNYIKRRTVQDELRNLKESFGWLNLWMFIMVVMTYVTMFRK